MSRYPFYDFFAEVLEDLYQASKHHLNNTLEAYISKLVLEVTPFLQNHIMLLVSTSA